MNEQEKKNMNGGWFSFEKLDAYRVSRELLGWVHQDLFKRLPRGMVMFGINSTGQPVA